MSDQAQEKARWLAFINEIHGSTALGALGGEVVDVDDDGIEMRMPITEKALQPFGLLHGGVSLLLAETAASTHATWGVNLNEKQPVGIEINGSHLNSAQTGTVRVEGRVLNRSRRLIVHEVRIIHEETGQLLTTARVTNYYRRVR